MVSLAAEVKSWLWIPAVWVVAYPFLVLIGIALGSLFSPAYYWWVMLIGVPLIVAPVTYKRLVGGGCSLRFQICALVKGMFAGVVFLMLTILADSVLWPNLALTVGWNPALYGVSEMFYQIWFFSGIIGGVGARIIEVRGHPTHSDITIVGLE